MHRELALGLSALATCMEPKEARRVCSELAAIFVRSGLWGPEITEGLSALTAWMEPREALAALVQVVSRSGANASLVRGLSAASAQTKPEYAVVPLMQAMTQETNPYKVEGLAQAVLSVLPQMKPQDAARVSVQAAALVSKAFSRLPAVNAQPTYLLQVTVSLTAHMKRPDAARVLGETADALLQGKIPENEALLSLPNHLSMLTVPMDPQQERQVWARAAEVILGSMKPTTAVNYLAAYAERLSWVAPRLEQTQATRVCTQAAGLLLNATPRAVRNDQLVPLIQAVAGLNPWVGPHERARITVQAVALLTRNLSRTTDSRDQDYLVWGLSQVFGDRRRTLPPLSLAAAAGYLSLPFGQPGALLLLGKTEPMPRWHSDQEFVELLKHPLCVGPARRAVVDQLAVHHGRTFADHWEFIGFAEEKKLGLDFNTPPKRPESLASKR
jgi:hypothetical protein